MTFLVVFCRRASRAVLLKEGLGVTSHCFLRAVARRPVSATRSLSSKQKGTVLKRWTLLVDPFSSLKVRLPCDVSVKALDPHGYPDADRVFVELLSPNQAENVDDVQVQYDKALKQMVVASENVSGDARIVLVTPVKFDLDISTFNKGCVKIKQMESDICYVETERGHSILNSLKAHKVKVQSRGGNVICLGTIHGNVDIQTSNKGVVEIDKLQGTTMNISTTNGTLKTKYIYAKSSHLSSSIGNIELGNIHDSSDGNLNATTQQGDLDVYVSQLGIVNLLTQEGSITLKVPKALRAKLQLSGSVVEISPELQMQEISSSTEQGHQTVQGFLNGKGEGAHLIEAHTMRGMLNIKSQSWIESLKLKPL
ncbi:protein FAM185A isoform X4 [Amblyraja radiata]|uniref:protein FAM185A isoform X4 n=1 Tax=Amblyraja radiata TaxID=386614 RepID=UPI001404035D|nr:protein FAM185A isoform X4 [Amblyraja radiata]